MPNITRLSPSRASGTDAKGIFPPMLRALSHIGFSMALVQAQLQENRDTTNDELLAEVDHIIGHWTLIVRPAYLGEEAVSALRVVTDQLPVLRESVTADDRNGFFRNLQNVMASILSAAVLIDTASYGLRHPEDTDAGTQL